MPLRKMLITYTATSDLPRTDQHGRVRYKQVCESGRRGRRRH